MSVAFYVFVSPARWAHFQAAAKEYAAKHNGENYFSALNKVSALCHLKVEEFIHSCLVKLTQRNQNLLLGYVIPKKCH